MKAMKMRQQNYYALSVVYVNLDAEDLTRFLSLFIDKTKDVDPPWYTELFGPSVGQVNEDYSEWNVMLQRITVLQEIQEVGVFRAYIYADSPDIKIEEGEESKALTINFKEYRNIGSEVVCIVILGCLLLGALCGWRYYEDQQRKKQDAYFTDKKITAYEMGIMVD